MKRVIWIIILVIGLIGVILRIIRINNSNDITVVLDKNSATELGFNSAEYIPISKDRLLLGDSTFFDPGSIWIHDAIEQKHVLFLFSEYYEKSDDPFDSKFKTIMYQSKGKANSDNLVLTTRKWDTVMVELTTNPSLDDYSLGQHVMDNSSDDTLKCYIKKATIIPNNKYFKIIMDYEPLDSILYVKHEK